MWHALLWEKYELPCDTKISKSLKKKVENKQTNQKKKKKTHTQLKKKKKKKKKTKTD